MDITQWYSVALGGLLALPVIPYVLLTVIKFARTYVTFYFLKHVLYPQIHQYLRGSHASAVAKVRAEPPNLHNRAEAPAANATPPGVDSAGPRIRQNRIDGKTTRLDGILIVAFVVGNILCITIRFKDISRLARRSGLMSTINLMPLSLGAHMNLIASCCGISLGANARIHRWLGRVAIAEGLIHSAAPLQKHNLRMQSDVAALIAAITMAVVLLSLVASVRRHVYEIFSKIHLILAAIVIAAIYPHCPSKEPWTAPTVYLFATICLRILISVLRFGQVLYRNVKYKKPLNRATVRTIIFKDGDKIPVLDAVHRRKGFTNTLFSHITNNLDHSTEMRAITEGPYGKGLELELYNDIGHNSEMRAILEGPYGNEFDLESYGTVLLFATGIGIAGQLPYVTQLLEEYHNWKVADIIMELLRRDKDKILYIRRFISGNYVLTKTKRGDVMPRRERISNTYDVINAESLISSKIEGRKGRTVVFLYTNNETSDKIREIVRRILDKDIHLKELDFRPYLPGGHKGWLRTVLNRMFNRERSKGNGRSV
ncbi:hypothetical protein AOQ84DRAFT_379187 [Glonium stellatum]|uniref:Ferric oxidoreductase domain-containing protein n=1 Tax=Glonium stellatum TaxID=574774 RepID=A0A8E2JQH1_9PEZI|nr:hypothetical protein AOQ84DRAFT_379187 [Glonium stellatum]